MSTIEERRGIIDELHKINIYSLTSAINAVSKTKTLMENSPKTLADRTRSAVVNLCSSLTAFLESIKEKGMTSAPPSPRTQKDQLCSLEKMLDSKLAAFGDEFKKILNERKINQIATEKSISSVSTLIQEKLPIIEENFEKVSGSLNAGLNKNNTILDNFRIEVSNRFSALGNTQVLIDSKTGSHSVTTPQTSALTSPRARSEPNEKLSVPPSIQPPICPKPPVPMRPSYDELKKGNFPPPPIKIGKKIIPPINKGNVIRLFPKSDSITPDEVWLGFKKAARGTPIQIKSNILKKNHIEITVEKPEQVTSIAVKLDKNDTVSCKPSVLLKPQICIWGVDNDLDNVALLDEIYNNNDYLRESTCWTKEEFFANISIVRSYQTKHHKTTNTKNVIVRCSPAIRNTIITVGHLYIGTEDSLCTDYTDPSRCFICQTLGGHHSLNCKNKNNPVCSQCLGAHETKNCESKTPTNNVKKCAVCYVVKRKHNGHVYGNNCPTYLDACEMTVYNTDYSWRKPGMGPPGNQPEKPCNESVQTEMQSNQSNLTAPGSSTPSF